MYVLFLAWCSTHARLSVLWRRTVADGAANGAALCQTACFANEPRKKVSLASPSFPRLPWFLPHYLSMIAVLCAHISTVCCALGVCAIYSHLLALRQPDLRRQHVRLFHPSGWFGEGYRRCCFGKRRAGHERERRKRRRGWRRRRRARCGRRRPQLLGR